MRRWICAAKLLPVCVLLAATVGGAVKAPAGGRVFPAGARVRTVILTPGRSENTAAGQSAAPAEDSAAARPLPNYQGETLPLGLLVR